jgi:hypothetical protein
MSPHPYPVLNLPPKLYRKVSTVLRYTVLIVRLKQPITSALYPYVHTLASGMSCVKNSSSQNSFCRAEPPLVLSTADALFLKIDGKAFRLFGIAAFWSLVPTRAPSQVCLGCKPWTNTMLYRVSQTAGIRVYLVPT